MIGNDKRNLLARYLPTRAQSNPNEFGRVLSPVARVGGGGEEGLGR